MMTTHLLDISRPRFWLYVLGSFLIGIGASMSLGQAIQFDPSIFFWMIYLTFPANIFIYGINDLADRDTDSENPKKGSYEAKIDKRDKRKIIITILVSNLIFTPLFLSSSKEELMFLSIFFIFNLFYSLKPLRLKAVPFLDSISNGIICTSIGLLGYISTGGSDFSIIAILAGFLWSSAMHAYSAIPDIESDRKADIKTIATELGKKNTLFLCLSIYLIITIIFVVGSLYWYTILVLPYIFLIFLSFRKIESSKSLFSVYKIFPFTTYIVGYLVYLFNTLI